MPGPAQHSEAAPRAGRNLPAAIGVGVGLIAVLVASVAWRPEPFAVLVAVALVLGLWELTQAFAKARIDLPLVPLAIGGIGIQVSAHLSGLPGVLVAFFLTVAAAVGWQALETADGPGRPALRDSAAAVFAAAYLPLLASFLVLLSLEPDGRWRVLAAIALSVASDTGGYLVGVLAGRHRLAPLI
ncbi:MAG: phosphatidate cytidylyltransferase, partial [Bifidobacteriaceae bacterium]|nr:phosphatidate cytidylyltransferase [Bifidobacteriaceae bacterium]